MNQTFRHTSSTSQELLPFLTDQILNAAAIYWIAKCSSRDMPNREDIDPLDMPSFILPNLALVERDASGDFRFRLCGTEIASRFSADPTGKLFAEVFSDKYCAYVTSLHDTVHSRGCTVYAESTFQFDDYTLSFDTLLTRRLIMPLRRRRDGGLMLMMAQTWPGADCILQNQYERLIDTADMERHLATLVNMRNLRDPRNVLLAGAL